MVRNPATTSDAINERGIIGKNFDAKKDGLIEISLLTMETGSVLRVSDNGLGMTPSDLENYFLSAGSSFLSSEQWREGFTDNGGVARILRIGRFGIGVLSAFLLGEKMRVRTRHHSLPDGVGFSTGLSFDPITVSKVPAEVGTTIEIEVSENKRTDIEEIFKTQKNRLFWYGRKFNRFACPTNFLSGFFCLILLFCLFYFILFFTFCNNTH